MKKYFFAMLTMAAALCGCSEKEILTEESPQAGGAGTNEVAETMVFTATMEGAPETKATYDGTYKCASWEVDDRISINGFDYKANNAGTSTTFSKVASAAPPMEMRPEFVSTTNTGSYQNQPAQNLVDDGGVSTRWIADKSQRVAGAWNIVVSTGQPFLLETIKLWNAANQSYPGRRWKTMKLYGSTSLDDEWEEISDPAPLTSSHPFANLNLAINNQGLAGEIAVNSTKAYTFYRIDVLDNEGDNYMQMSDMKFVVAESETLESPYTAYFPADLYQQEHLVLPSRITETWADGKFNMPMYAHSESTDLQFKNLCGVLKVIVKNSQMARVKHITVSSSNHAMSGAFAVDANNAAILLNPTETSLTKTVNYTNAVETSAEGTVFYVAIPAQTYQDLTIVVSDGTDCKDMVTKSGRDIVVERNKIYPVTFEDNTPYSGFGIAVIDGVEVDVPWVQLWAGGPKWATYNVGAEHSRPQDYGGYYAWGGCIDKGSDYYADELDLTGEHDTATKLWGNNWRMPSHDDDLFMMVNIQHLPSSSTTLNGVKGMQITGTGDYACNSLFIPYSGYYDNGSLRRATEQAFVWAAITQNGLRTDGPRGEIYRNALWVIDSGPLLSGDRNIKTTAHSVRAIFKR